MPKTRDMRTLIAEWNGLAVVANFDRATSSWIFIALHDATLGTPLGGTRMKAYSNPEEGLRDAMRLAEGMTYKWAGIEFGFGGGKAVLAVPRQLRGTPREGLLRRYGRLVESLGGGFATGEDLGTTPEDMLVIAQETRHVHGVDRDRGQTVDPGPYTARGVIAGMRAALRHRFGDPAFDGRRVLVQGVGDVGAPLARELQRCGAIVLLSDLQAQRSRELAQELGAEIVPPHQVYETSCDIYAPCAVGATLNLGTIPEIQCAIVAGAANNQLEETEDAGRLHERDILYAPDYIVNAGGAIALAMLSRGDGEEQIIARVDAIGDTLGEIFAEAASSEKSPAAAAHRRVKRILEQARQRRG